MNKSILWKKISYQCVCYKILAFSTRPFPTSQRLFHFHEVCLLIQPWESYQNNVSCAAVRALASHLCGPGFDSWTWHHMWIEFVGSLLCFEGFSLGSLVFLPHKNQPWFDLGCAPWPDMSHMVVDWGSLMYAFESATLSCVPTMQLLGCKWDDYPIPIYFLFLWA